MYRREDWRERKEILRGTMGRGKRRGDAPPFSLLASYPERFLFFDYCYFIGEALRRRELGLLSQCHAAFQETIPMLMLVPYIEPTLC